MEKLKIDDLEAVIGGNKTSMVDSKACLKCGKQFPVSQLVDGCCALCRDSSVKEMSGLMKRATC